MKNNVIEVQNVKVNVTNMNDNDYICISDFTKFKEGKSTSDDIIRNWLRNRITLEFLGTWESIYNPNFNSVEFDGFRKNAGLHTFTLSVSQWCEKTNAIGIYSKRGKYGGTYAHKDIAFEFASAISPVLKLYLIKEFERLKQIENQNREWDIKRILTKNNYLIHTLNYLSKEQNYIMYINPKNICYVSYNFEPVSQMMRKIIAKDLGYENKFDWKKEIFIENINSTIKKFTEGSDKNG